MPAAAAAAVSAAVMLGPGLWGLDRGTMWRDESATFQIARRSLPEIWHLLGELDAVHGLYYLLMHPVLAVRADEVALRIPSVCAAACTAGLVAALGARLARPRVGLWAGLLYAVTPFATHYAQEGRSYALVAAGAALATWCLVRAIERGTVGRWTAYGAAVAVSAVVHEFALLMLAAHAVTVLCMRGDRRARRSWATAAGAAVAVLLPLVVISFRQGAQISWIVKPGPEQLKHLLLQFTGPSGVVLTATLLLAAAVVLVPLPRRGPVGLVAVALPLAVLPPALLFAVSLVKPLFVDRYLLFALAGVPLLVAGGMERVLSVPRGGSRAVWRPVAAATGVAVIAAAFWWQLPFHRHERGTASRVDDLHAVAAQVAADAREGDGVVFVPSYQRHISLTYTGEFTGLRDLALKTSAAESGTLEGVEVAPEAFEQRLRSVRRVWVVGWPGSARQAWFLEDPKGEAIRHRFREARTVSLPSGVVQLYVRR
ncbi:glycosyltransferase family 39 protein [Streptomyces sp. NPDC057426]|uniref:glycosyltransferase family 39 protein n=1 Tax=Streptomyces sp. NPDC057426 TaxID=3346128 RepID=UPI0036802F3B